MTSLAIDDDVHALPVLLRGEIVFDHNVPGLEKAAMHIFLEDTSLADDSAQVIVHEVIGNITPAMAGAGRVPFVLYGEIPDKRAHYTVRVHINMERVGKISHGDYINTESYPVLTRGHSDQVIVHVKPVR